MSYTNSDYYEMMLCVGARDGNLRAARQLYYERFIEGRSTAEARQLPSLGAFRRMTHRLHQRFKCWTRSTASAKIRQSCYGKQFDISTWRCPSTFRTWSKELPRCALPAVDRTRRSNRLASAISRPYPAGLFFMGIHKKHCVCSGVHDWAGDERPHQCRF